ncbi:DUF6452 family protein [Reichenbachiella carrageenanivorans]|uniref:DUF6452 family protein n=1 Tax=Reichenbachiella carrageenanivorans TaxID=2979869 RepID=A0ABY6D2K9_9BACT|nr:DUF6452 family protein [Reichenbachiella carrageenanivorans]UXX79984.1 DUF6452 family protein [Reichenbachiella carrageenanivorans]
MNFKMRETVILCFGILMLWACGKEPDCNLSVPKSSIRVNFYNEDDSTAHYMKFVGVTECSTDQIFYTSADSLASFDLNLNPEAEQVTYVFVSSTSVDTLTLSYTKELEWLSEECGPSFFYDELNVEGSSYTYELVSTFIDVSIDENIKIYN